MRRFAVVLLLGFEKRPSREDQAFLGELGARAQPWGIAELQVSLEVDATDVAAALSQAKEQVADRLGGEVQMARIGVAGTYVSPGSFWQRLRRR
jgi:hypothetical protein